MTSAVNKTNDEEKHVSNVIYTASTTILKNDLPVQDSN